MTLTMQKIAIVGLGVIGGSFAKALAAQDKFPVEVMGIDHNLATLQRAQADGVISRGEARNQTILQEADLVIITLYPFDLVDFIRSHQDEFKAGAIITDATGVKGAMVEEVWQLLPAGLDFIAGHPMAGKENQGYDYADGTVYQDANYLLMPDDRNDPAHVQALTELIYSLGFKRVSQVSAHQHDAMIAYTSQLCHVLSVALINADQNQAETIRYVGDSYRDLTRIAKINGELWTQLFVTNKDQLLPVIDAFAEQLQGIRQALADDDYAQLNAYFDESSQRRLRLEQADVKLQGQAVDIEE
ncbi:hypothetical protein AWM75_07745 [Aerococcus urinaehominis]|uniref:Uncharacterized protein n=1 Tax=Aerococcus urinaehominis TaxID=128944 RepID=A0A109RHA2_9LACT|nr:prephenate dehydrogenase [Aerococcus urinaehominis]AMB99864.1 hypothetical protein AWM75_07745 [Aerococcus urinaehominis]SDM54180.1 prephenate dehydrogenase [Aerococcus urinaehominis]